MGIKESRYIKLGKRIYLSVLVGALAGITSTFFLYLLNIATNFRLQNSILIWFLPLGGLLTGCLYHYYGKEAARGNNLILEEIHNPNNTLPFLMAPLVLVGTLITHLFGGSAGREGTAVQMAATFADQVAKFFKVDPHERKILLMAAAGAGFGSALGAPLAGVIFGMEVIYIGKLHLKYFIECLVASLSAHFVGLMLLAPHTLYPTIEIPWDFKIIPYVVLAGIIFGIAALIFSRLTHFIESLAKKLVPIPWLVPFISGIVLVTLFFLEGSYRYSGLGIITIQESLEKAALMRDPVLKTFFTALTVGTGFKGGEFIPLVFIGTTLGSALGLILPVSFSLLGALGFASVFAGAANTPLACAVMAAEIFGWKIFFYALITCYASYYFSGHPGIYGRQMLLRRKHHFLENLFSRR